jgi:hypothetical protein
VSDNTGPNVRPRGGRKRHTFERSAIDERVLVNRPGICPLTNGRYPNGDARLAPNRAVRSMIETFNEAAAGAAACARYAVMH